MKAVVCHAFGPPEDLAIEETVSPEPGPGQVRISTRAIGVNFSDHMLVRGLRGSAVAFPFSPGMEAAGIVEAVGPGVTSLTLGARVVSYCRIGGYAQEVLADAIATFPIPDDMDFVTAAGLLIGHGTAQYALKERADLKPGEILLVLGAGGGAGLAAVEVGKVMGARVIAAASTPEKRGLAAQAGAEVVLDSSAPDLPAQVIAHLGGPLADVVFDPIGPADVEALMKTLRLRGRHLIIGSAGGKAPDVSFDAVFFQELALLGVFFGPFMLREPERNAANIAQLLDWGRQGLVKPLIAETPRLDEARNVLRRAMERRLTGKVVLIP